MKRLIFAACFSVPLLAGAQGNSSAGARPADQAKEKRAKAVARCKANRGVDCESAEGLKEWLLLERSRREAVRDRSRSRPPPQ
jgi:hypothetical protein